MSRGAALFLATLRYGHDGDHKRRRATVHNRGEKIFELSNHLGNVLVTVSDRKLAVDDGSDGDITAIRQML